MRIRAIAAKGKRPTAQGLVIPFWKGEKGAEVASAQAKGYLELVQSLLHSGDFTGKEGEVALCYCDDLPERRLICLGLGTDARRGAAGLVAWCHSHKVTDLNLLAFDGLQALLEGIGMANYTDPRKGEQAEEKELQSINLIGPVTKGVLEITLPVLERLRWVRDLVNENADTVTPLRLCQEAKELARRYKSLQTLTIEGPQVEAKGLGLLHAVGRGAVNPPALIQVRYQGAPRSKEQLVLLGKGITYDTGGLSIKTADGMETMRMDMAGAATVLGAVALAAELKLPINCTAVVAAAENAIGSRSYRPGDVFTSYSGKRVEVNNTDAEGRLVLADALGYIGKNLKPTQIIDLATLTGAIVIALGDDIAGIWSNSDPLAEQLIQAGQRSGDLLWRMPLYQPYRDKLKSSAADIKNTGGGRAAGSIKAALFLKDFVPASVDWAHLDIAGTAYLAEKGRYGMKGATGYGLRLLLEFLQSR
jgi:leucyl aminopeptidase